MYRRHHLINLPLVQSFENNKLKLKLINNKAEDNLINIPIEYNQEDYINLNKISNCPIHPSIDKLMNIELSRIVWDKDELMKNLLELLVINDD